jgi:hypothetical protein
VTLLLWLFSSARRSISEFGPTQPIHWLPSNLSADGRRNCTRGCTEGRCSPPPPHVPRHCSPLHRQHASPHLWIPITLQHWFTIHFKIILQSMPSYGDAPANCI